MDELIYIMFVLFFIYLFTILYFQSFLVYLQDYGEEHRDFIELSLTYMGNKTDIVSFGGVHGSHI